MADTTIPQSTIDTLTAIIDPVKVQAYFTAYKDGSSIAGQALSNTQDGVKKLSVEMDGITKKVKEFNDMIARGGISQWLNTFSNGASKITPILKDLIGQTGLIGSAMLGLLPASESFSIMGKGADIATSNIDEVNKGMQELAVSASKIPIIGNDLAAVIVQINKFQNIAAPAKEFENGIIAIAAQSGNLSNLMKQLGDDFSGTERVSVKFSDTILQIANASGISSSQVAAYAHQLMAIPGAMDLSVKGLDGAANSMHMLDAAIKVAAGTGQSFDAVFKDLNTVYLNFGTTGQKALEFVTRLSSVSNELRIPLSIVKDVTTQAAINFKFLGDNTQGALTILEKFGTALQKTGLGAEAIKDLSRNFIESIAKMDVAQEAFISSQTGGVGGLQGAAQIDLLKQQGKIEEVAKLIEQAVRKQFGGNIITTAQATGNQAAAAQRERQLLLLQQGPTAIAGSRDQAIAISEAMAKGTLISSGLIGKSSGDAFKEALTTGDKLQQKQYDGTVAIVNEIKHLSEFAAISAYAAARQVAGSGNAANNQFIQQFRDQSEVFAANLAKSAPGQPEVVGRSLKEAIDQGLSKNTIGGGLSASKEFLGNVIGGTVTNLKDLTAGILNKPTNPAETVAGALPKPGEIPRSTPGQPQIPTPVEVKVSTMCERCTRDISQEEARKISNQHIEKYDTNRNTSGAAGGVNPGWF